MHYLAIDLGSSFIKGAVLDLDAHVRPGEDRGRQAHERGQRDQEHVERVDEELPVAREQVPFADHARRERGRREEARTALADSGVSALADRAAPEIVAANKLSAVLG